MLPIKMGMISRHTLSHSILLMHSICVSDAENGTTTLKPYLGTSMLMQIWVDVGNSIPRADILENPVTVTGNGIVMIFL
jgi:hypothetical protein